MTTRMVVLTLAAAWFASAVHAQSWNQWRGPQRDGVLAASAVPAVWPQQYQPVWEAEVGEGYSSPVVHGTSVFVHSRVDPDEVVTSIDLASGQVQWSHKYTATFTKNQYANEMAKGPNATPLVADGRLFTLGVTGILTAWDAASGQQIWRNDYSATVDTSKLFCGTAASPVLVEGRLIVHVGSDVHGGQILALDPKTGNEIWKWKGTGPGYASPIVVENSGSKQFINMTDSSIIGLDVASGKELWSIPFPDEWQENIVTPLWTGSLLVVSGTRQGTHAFKIELDGETWKPTKVWENREVAMYMSSPVLGDGLIYGHSARKKGQFVGVDAATGELRWASQGRDARHAAMLLAPKNLVLLTDEGRLIVADRGSREFHPTNTYQLVDGGTWSIPVMMNDDLIVRDSKRILRLTGKN